MTIKQSGNQIIIDWEQTEFNQNQVTVLTQEDFIKLRDLISDFDDYEFNLVKKANLEEAKIHAQQSHNQAKADLIEDQGNWFINHLSDKD